MSHKLFQPFNLKSLTLTNRTVMAPMTRCRAGEGDAPTPLMAEYYAQRATAGLIITEGVPVSPQGRGYLWTPGIYTEEQITRWKSVTQAVHDKGGRVFTQLWHVGRVSHNSLQPKGGAPESPTDEQPDGASCFAYDENGNPANVPTSPPQELGIDGIQRIKGEFVQAANNAIEAGMDGVEIHSANGYLFDEFLNSVVNTRGDNYGGSVENRCRFLLETLDAVTAAIGIERTGVRISPNGRFNAMPEDPEMEATFLYLAQELDHRGIAYLHINDQATFGMPAIPEGLIPKIRAAFKGPIILCGGYDAHLAQDAIDEGIADLVAFGVPFLANPDLPARLENGWPLNEPDRDTFYGGGEKGYTDYPQHKP
jgi:2,4-dienoyl-CoA reductase-like NADH-dependent reductase (Old Yellow Enzyme family)